ncbi:H-type small acid-soluble spore protein [Aquibacillus kalidii]|uniref:H-type small acid-soluble spore protein n=1 Tax=Aquibacillus kalidii TaxID=2762597 RepID=UPI00164647C8|nr:H-type small acid-soluble spore protein [Aquibacillus kalidii]
MDPKRAQEITSSINMVDVRYNGSKVYIEHVDQDVGKATIHPINDPEKKQSVSVNDLTEG